MKIRKITYSIAALVAFICVAMYAIRFSSFNWFVILGEEIPTKRLLQ